MEQLGSLAGAAVRKSALGTLASQQANIQKEKIVICVFAEKHK